MKRTITAAMCMFALLSASAEAEQATTATAAPTQAASAGVLMVRVYAADVARSQRFYTDVFGMRATPQRPDEIAMAFPGAGVGIIINANHADAPMKSGFIARTPNIDETVSRVEAAGGHVLRPASSVPGMGLKVAVIADPDGSEIELIQLPSH